MVHDHDHDDGRCPLCPTDEQLAAMRERNREQRRIQREDVLLTVAGAPTSWVHAIEARSEGDHDIVMHVASTVAKARDWCSRRPASEYGGGTRYHVIPHQVDGDDRRSGVVSVAVYGVADDADAPADLVGTDLE